MLRLVNLAGSILLYGLLKFKALFAKKFRDLLSGVLNFYSNSKFKTFFNFKLCIKICSKLNNDFKLTQFAFDV